jgi:predicted transcriptional regulator
MTERILTIRVESADEMFDRVSDIARRLDAGDPGCRDESLSFESMSTFLAAITPKRLSLVSALKKLGPCSIRALSRAVGRDYKTIHLDVTKLTDLGLIEKRDNDLIEAPYDWIVSKLRLAA